MADVAETTTYPDAMAAISQGKRHLLVQDYTAAVTALAEGLEMMSQKLGDVDDQLGEPYLLYGRALLGLAREEAGVLGEAVPGSEDADDDEEADEEDDEKMSDVEEKDEEMETDAEEKKEATGKETEAEKKADKPEKGESEKSKDKSDSGKPVTEIQAADSTENESVDGKNEKKAESSNKTDDKKVEEKKLEKSAAGSSTDEQAVAGTSKGLQNGSQRCNGAPGKSDAMDEDDVMKEDEDEDPGRGIDLQVAWEVLELAKIVFGKRGESGLKNLAETHRLLGEVAMESDNPQLAIADLEGALKLLEKLEPADPRAVAEIHYELGLAHSLANDFDASIEQFGLATTLLEARIKQLEEIKEPAKTEDVFYTVAGEIKELKELLPAIQEKITDMKDFKEEACRLVIEGIKNKVAGGGCTNGAGTSHDGPSSSTSSSAAQSSVSPKPAKPASDISHLVRKKRKTEDGEEPVSPCKKPTP